MHDIAATTPKTRAYIQASPASLAELTAQLGISPKTVRRWKSRSTTQDRTSKPKQINSSLSAV